MATPRVCILRAPGTNCDLETAAAFERCGAEAERVHVYRLLDQPELLQQFQILCVPGGFSYGDDIGAGVIFSQQLRHQLGDALREFLLGDKLALGICNGFQTLLKAGLLPGGADGLNDQSGQPRVTLTWNTNGRYTARWVRCLVRSEKNVFLRGISEIDLPVAHAEGRIAVSDSTLPAEWEAGGQIALQYVHPEHAIPSRELLPYPHNPNGSTANIAGLSDPSGRILGLMPHPERYLHATQHPNWTRHKPLTKPDGHGLKVFQNAVDYFG